MRELERRGVEVWNAGTGSVFWLRGPSEPHADGVHWDMPSNTHTQPTWIIWMSWVSCSMLGQECCFPNAELKNSSRSSLFLLSFHLSLSFFYISAHHFDQLPCYSHTNSVIIQTLNKLYNHSCPLPNRGCAGLSEINLHILNISYWSVTIPPLNLKGKCVIFQC